MMSKAALDWYALLLLVLLVHSCCGQIGPISTKNTVAVANDVLWRMTRSSSEVLKELKTVQSKNCLWDEKKLDGI